MAKCWGTDRKLKVSISIFKKSHIGGLFPQKGSHVCFMNSVWSVWHPQQTSYLHFTKGLPQHLLISSWALSWALSYIFGGTSELIVCKEFTAWCSSSNSCLSSTLLLHQCPPCTLLLLILSCRWALLSHFCHTVPEHCPWPEHYLCWHPKGRTGFLFFTAWAEPLIHSVFTSALPVQDIADEDLGTAKDFLNVFVWKKSAFYWGRNIQKTAMAWGRNILTSQNNN